MYKMKKISAKIVADSINQQGDRITTYLLTFPRFILAELNTHRVFSKNSASSRAIPFHKMVKMIEEDPFIPIAWQKPHKGMQGTKYYDHTLTEEVGELDYKNLPRRWLRARDTAVSMAKIMVDERGNMPVTKQLANRLLEPFMWHTVLLTGTEFENFFELRCPKYHTPVSGDSFYFKSKKDCIANHSNPINLKKLEDMSNIEWLQINFSQAEIHMQALAEAMWDAMNESTPKELKEGEWHIPFGGRIDESKIVDILNEDGVRGNYWGYKEEMDYKIKISTARCARLSYMTFNGEIDYEKDVKLHDTLLESQHMSPFEHCAKAMSDLEYYSFIKGRVPTQRDEYGIFNYEYYPYSNGKIDRDGEFWMGFIGANPNNGDRFGWCNNFKGFIQYRYLIEERQ